MLCWKVYTFYVVDSICFNDIKVWAGMCSCSWLFDIWFLKYLSVYTCMTLGFTFRYRISSQYTVYKYYNFINPRDAEHSLKVQNVCLPLLRHSCLWVHKICNVADFQCLNECILCGEYYAWSWLSMRHDILIKIPKIRRESYHKG